MKPLKFGKHQRVTSKKCIEALFSSNAGSVFLHPFKISYIKSDEGQVINCKVLITASKKKFTTAVKRNKVKRQLRELYRTKQHILNEYLILKNMFIQISLNYVGSELLNFKIHTVVFEKCLKKFIQEVEKTN